MLTSSLAAQGSEPKATASSRVTVAMLGARRHYAVPRLLHEAGLLDRFFTDSYSGNKPWRRRAVAAAPAALRPASLERWLGRADASLPPERVVSFEGLGWWYAWARRRRARTAHEAQAVFEEFAACFNRRILAHPAFADAEIVWGFNGASLGFFNAARAQSRHRILEQTILPKRLEAQLLAEEAERWPGWDPCPAAGAASLTQSADPLEEAEWVLADRIVAGSDFVRDGLIRLGVPPAKVRVVPYGVDARRFIRAAEAPVPSSPSTGRGPLRVLFAGEVGLRKGVPDLLKALGRLSANSIAARLAGRIALADDKLRDLPASVQVLGPVPRSRMAELFRWADVFVLPSIVEGSATVTYEALMSGVPVVATPNAGAPVRDGIDGVIVPIRNPRALADALQSYLDEPDLLYAHQAAAVRDKHRIGLDVYRDRLVAVVQHLGSKGLSSSTPSPD